ncbi:hypothetical protein IEQ34_019170 [Dendrobium chrysotoxum]|uniref:Uncharacterized protein n=1 Tax=Dendrobium chrysotoxum TaxID=161865 RepID=A0AAV7G680_DENCH|nr:hypothetical protein IEQ34_019170 [Dendrobium chrysotoxum]
MAMNRMVDPGFLAGSSKLCSFLDALSGNFSNANFPHLKVTSFHGLPSLWISEEEILAIVATFQFTLVAQAHRRFFGALLNPSHVLINLVNDLDYSRIFSYRSYFLNNCYMNLTKWSSLFDIGVEQSFLYWSLLVTCGLTFSHLISFMLWVRCLVILLKLIMPPMWAHVPQWHAAWLGPEKFGYIQCVEMGVFPPYCGHCKCLGHLKGDCHPISTSSPGFPSANPNFPITVDENVNTVVENLETFTPSFVPLSPTILVDNGDINLEVPLAVDVCPGDNEILGANNCLINLIPSTIAPPSLKVGDEVKVVTEDAVNSISLNSGVCAFHTLGVGVSDVEVAGGDDADSNGVVAASDESRLVPLEPL